VRELDIFVLLSRKCFHP